MSAVFVTSYTLALGRPTPRDVPAAIVGDSAQNTAVVNAFESALDHSVDFRSYPSTTAARTALVNQNVYAVLVLTADPPQLLIASAAGVSVARVLEEAANSAATAVDRPVQLIDVRPLPATDPSGLGSFYTTLTATLLGFVTLYQLRSWAPTMSLQGWYATVAGLAVGGGLVLAVIVDPVINVLRPPFVELWAVLAGEIAAAAMFNCVLLVLIGPLAIIPAWLLLVAIGNASSGGAVAAPLLPPFFAIAGHILPQAATVNILHTATYFTDEQQLEPFLVLGAWIVVGGIALEVVARRRGRTPGGAQLRT